MAENKNQSTTAGPDKPEVTTDVNKPAVTSTPTVTKEEPPVKENKKNTIEIDADKLSAILDRVKSLEVAQKEYEKTASQDQIAKIEALRRSGKLVKSVKLRSVDGSLVLGWKMIEDEVWFEGSILKEKQTVRVWIEGGEEKEMSLRDFTRLASYVPFEVIKESRDKEGEMMYTVQDKEGKELSINEKYVN